MTKDCSECRHFDPFHTSRACHDCKPWKSSKKKDMTREEAIHLIENHKYPQASEAWAKLSNEAIDMAIEALKDRPHGEWKNTITWQPYCSNCEYVFDEDEEYSPFWKFCPMCGAEMADNSLVNDITESSNDVVKSKDDVIEVVRCKDCRHANECHKSVQYTRSEPSSVTIGYTKIDFCSHGERREE